MKDELCGGFRVEGKNCRVHLYPCRNPDERNTPPGNRKDIPCRSVPSTKNDGRDPVFKESAACFPGILSGRFSRGRGVDDLVDKGSGPFEHVLTHRAPTGQKVDIASFQALQCRACAQVCPGYSAPLPCLLNQRICPLQSNRTPHSGNRIDEKTDIWGILDHASVPLSVLRYCPF